MRDIGEGPFKVDEVADLLGVCSTTVKRACRVGSIRSIRFGKAIMIPRESLERAFTEGFKTTPSRIKENA